MPNDSKDSNSASEQPISSAEANAQSLAGLETELKEMQTRLHTVIAQRDEYAATNERLRQNFQTTHIGLQQAQREIDALRFQSSLLQKQLSEGTANSVVWRLTARLRAILPDPVRKAVRRITAKARTFFRRFSFSRHSPVIMPPALLVRELEHPPGSRLVQELLSERFAPFRALSVYRSPRETKRLNVLTDKIFAMNGVEESGKTRTALALAAGVAAHIGARLRIITRLEPARAENVATTLAQEKLSWGREIEFVFAPVHGGFDLSMGDEEFFLTTSWRTTRSVLPVLDPSRVIYLVQDDERLLCCCADDRLRCHETLSDAAVRFAISTETLFDHFVKGPDPLYNIMERGIWFEPARPAFEKTRTCDGLPPMRQFLFNGSPHDPQDLYWRGLEALLQCLEDNVLNPHEWEFHFISDGAQEVILPRGARAFVIPNHRWRDYVSNLLPTGIGLALRDSPHPGHAVLDLAAAGATMVTSRFGSKTSLARYSDRIICAEPTLADLIRAIATAVALPSDGSLPPAKHEIETDWAAALQPVVQHLFPRA